MFQTCLLPYFTYSAMFQRLARIELTLGQVPFVTTEHKEIFALSVIDQPTAGLYNIELLPEGLFQGLQIVVNKDPGMYLFLAHLMDHRVDGRMRKLIDQHSVVMMGVNADLIRHPVTEEKGFVVKVDLDIHTPKIPTFAPWLRKLLPPMSPQSPKNSFRYRRSA